MSQAGIQVSSIKAYLQTPEDVLTSFKRLSAMGCRIVQLQWMNPEIPPAVIASALSEAGLVSVSTQDAYDTVTQNLPYFTELHRLCGSSHLCVGGIPERFRSAEGCLAYARELEQLAAQLAAMGLSLSLHPRVQEYDLFDGVPGVRILMENTRSLLLGLDIYHVLKAGLDPVAWIRAFSGRIDFVHFKDKAHDADGSEYLTPVGQGETDWAPVVSACLEAEIPWAFAEQETWRKDAFLCLKESFDWMLDQGFEA